jgi:hypothetical protein
MSTGTIVPFLRLEDVATAKTVSRGIPLAMLRLGGIAFGRYAGYGSWKAGALTAGPGTGLVLIINALDG